MTLILIAAIPLLIKATPIAYADDFQLSAADLADEIVWCLKNWPASECQSWVPPTAHELADMLEKSLDARLEIEAAAQANPKIFLAFIKLATLPAFFANDDASFLVANLLRISNLDIFLEKLKDPTLDTSAVLNLLPVFRGWVIRDREICDKIKITLNEIETRYKDDGYIWRFRLGTRQFSDQQEQAVTQAIQLIRAKNLVR